jgi:hypothetical protein
MGQAARWLRRIGPRRNIRRDRMAWAVVVERGQESFNGHFSDAAWGGRAQALVAAQRFRDRLLQRIDGDARVRRQSPRGLRSKTGIVGVIRELHRVGGRVYERFVASWPDAETGRSCRRRFSIQHYGEDVALALAVEARAKGVARRLAYLGRRQRGDAARRLAMAPPMPRQVKDPRSRRGISMARRRPRQTVRTVAHPRPRRPSRRKARRPTS